MALDAKENKGRSPEESEKFGRNRPGVYLHKATGKIMTVTTTPAADAMAMQGWEFQRPATADDLRPTPAEESDSGDKEKALRKQLKKANADKELAEKQAAEAKEAQGQAEQAAEIARSDADAAQKLAEEAEAARKLAESADPSGANTNPADKKGK